MSFSAEVINGEAGVIKPPQSLRCIYSLGFRHIRSKKLVFDFLGGSPPIILVDIILLM